MKQALYKTMLSLIPPQIDRLWGTGLDQRAEAELLSILRHHRAYGGVLRLFDRNGRLAAYHFGMAGQNRPMRDDTVFRVASISKMITALCVLKLVQQGRVALDVDTGLFPRPVTLYQMMSHTAGIQDGEAYREGIEQGALLDDVASKSMQGGASGSWAYSNLGAGAIASALEAQLGQSFETIMQENLFRPLGINASFYPQRVEGELADARRVFPLEKSPGFDADKRRARPDDSIDVPDPQRHYILAQGNCCISPGELQRLFEALMVEGYLNHESLEMMRHPVAAFGRGRQVLNQGLGLFCLHDEEIYASRLYGHQGKAYGAVHAAFFEKEKERGMIFLSSGISEAREGFLADAVCDLLRFSFREDMWA